MKSLPEILCFASGGIDIGFGHLHRLTNLIASLRLESKAIFIATNQIEKEFLSNAKLSIETLGSSEMFKYNHIIIDSKYDCMNIIDSFTKNKENIIIIDNLDEWTKRSSSIVIPSFFINKDQVESSNLLNDDKLLWGKEYVILKDPKVIRKQINNKILLTFGGSDPYNISYKILKILLKTPYKDRLRLIIGPGYPHNKDYLLKEGSDIDIVINSNNMAEEISSASLIITSFGTILQEAEFYGKKVIIGCNYSKDKDDYFWLKKCTRNSNNWRCLGEWDEINASRLEDFIYELDSIGESTIDKDISWGNSWKELLTI